MLNITAINNHIFVKEAIKENISNGLYIPASALGLPNQGTVVAVGPGKYLKNGQRYQMSVNAGDIIVYDPLECVEITINGEDYIILEDHEVLAVLD